MTSISGKTTINWTEFAERLAPVEVISEPVLVKKRSRDCFWYSPVLNEELKKSFGDLVAVPKTNAELSNAYHLPMNTMSQLSCGGAVREIMVRRFRLMVD